MRLVLGLCDRFGCLPWPGSLMEQPGELLGMVAAEQYAGPDPKPAATEPEWPDG